ncbi:unnamed protein product [Gemmata massiliana]|uniref:Uncharacterized protein n=1 Tax=Gemmata massiliana TaxID=1210884 RepID=A0A6P2DJN5_9BACT|nr:unnamed protein product [Gemmata massiliana]
MAAGTVPYGSRVPRHGSEVPVSVEDLFSRNRELLFVSTARQIASPRRTDRTTASFRGVAPFPERFEPRRAQIGAIAERSYPPGAHYREGNLGEPRLLCRSTAVSVGRRAVRPFTTSLRRGACPCKRFPLGFGPIQSPGRFTCRDYPRSGIGTHCRLANCLVNLIGIECSTFEPNRAPEFSIAVRVNRLVCERRLSKPRSPIKKHESGR